MPHSVHTQYFGEKLLAAKRDFRWYPTDPDPASRASEQAYINEGEPLLRDRVAPPMPLTLSADGIIEQPTQATLSAEGSIDLVMNINMIHISPWSATVGLMKVAGEMLKPGGRLYLYGPYRVDGRCVESNL